MKKYDYTSAKDAHWRIDELAGVVNDLTGVVDSHAQDLGSIKKTGNAIKTSLYTLALVIAAGEVGLIETLRRLIGI